MSTSGNDRWDTAPVESGAAAGFGVYLHVPFCHHRCGYCDFAVAAVRTMDDEHRRELQARYVDALTIDLARQVAAGPGAHAPPGAAQGADWPVVTSVFVGGGTPTLLPPVLLARVVGAVGRELPLAADAEVTVELNPETTTPARLEAMVDAGATRLSVGAQSFTPRVLATLERGHDVRAVERTVSAARSAGIAAVGVDLIYGTPGETDDDWRHSLASVDALGVDHVSAYALTIHEGTPFGRRVVRGQLPAVIEDVQAARFDRLREVLGAAAGYDHYEVSNLARQPSARSRHNLLYWRHGDYLGVGAGAHGHLGGRRWWSVRSTPRYVHHVLAGDGGYRSALAGDEVLDRPQRAAERLLLGLRLREGIPTDDLPPVDPAAMRRAIAAGLVEQVDGRLRCTDQGWFLLDSAVDLLTG